ncbi:uncharacterized protein H6S33_001151 [Morchella sextelata]|uniref:uncharacterized protein n=1 Tax=Morchella sextelata TaxID=1174677 RepID=UPI001D037A2E|nr:uncharacterized protein H6S33_001151 [Morchella sextelata]KAH0608923.1 hypothetical protein H6S33_001151 [Morchella sextelata]
MQCGICTTEKRHLTCTSCSQERAWELRYETLLRITERDALAERVHDYLESSRGSVDALAAQAAEARERISKIREETRRLKELNAADTIKLNELRASTAARHDTLTDARAALFRLPQASQALTRDTKRLTTKHKTLHTRTAEARTFLCREAAALYNLRQKRKKAPPPPTTTTTTTSTTSTQPQPPPPPPPPQPTYHIGGVPIPNLLTDLNTHAPAQITTALTHLSHLLVLTSHYLGLKLPHEILLPTRDTPTTSIRGVLNNRHLATRPLHLAVPLAALARENNAGYTKFIEGLGMLAVDVAWLCYSQGLDDVNSVEEACAPGAAMWRLLVAKEVVPGFGRCSHATAAGNLATAGGAMGMKGFRVGLAAVVERVRFTVMGEAIGAEWDLVEEVERGVEGSGEVVVAPVRGEEGGGEGGGGGGGFSGWSQLQAASVGISGWTRIRSKAEKEGK